MLPGASRYWSLQLSKDNTAAADIADQPDEDPLPDAEQPEDPLQSVDQGDHMPMDLNMGGLEEGLTPAGLRDLLVGDQVMTWPQS